MAIAPTCDVKDCKRELRAFGALLFGPVIDRKRKKFHICIENGCYSRVRAAVLCCNAVERTLPHSAPLLVSAPDGTDVDDMGIDPETWPNITAQFIE